MFESNEAREPQELPESTEVEQDQQPPAEIPPVVPAAPRPSPLTRENVIAVALFVIILIAGTYFRFTGQNWDDFTHLHPDERYLTGVVEKIGRPDLQPSGSDADKAAQLQLCQQRYPQTNGAATSIFDSQCSTWWPKNAGEGTYAYGELPLFIVKGLAQLTAQASGDIEWTRYNGIHLVGRSMSAVTDLLALCFLFLIGRRLYNKWVGLLAMALGAATVFQIQLSHYWTTDAITNLPIVIAFWFAVRAMDRARWYDFVGFGVGMGAALACRINTAPFFGLIVLAGIIYALPAFDITLPGSERTRLIGKVILGCIVALFFTIGTFRILMPHAFMGGPGILGFFNVIPNRSWIDELTKSQAFASGSVDFPPNHQWANRQSYIFPWRNMVLWGMGLPLGLMAWIGWAWAGLQILRARPLWTRHILTVTWILVYFGYMGRQWVMTMRYYINLYPFLILMAAWALYEVFTRAWPRLANARAQHAAPLQIPSRLVRVGGTLLMIGVLLGTYLWAAMFVRIYQRQLTRVEASRWVMLNLPATFATTLTTDDGRTRLINLPVSGNATVDLNVSRFDPLQQQMWPFTVQIGIPVDRVVVSHISDPERSGKNKRFTVAISADQDGVEILAQGTIEADFGVSSDPLGNSYTIMLDHPPVLAAARSYYLMAWSEGRLNVARGDNRSAEFTLTNNQNLTVAQLRLPDHNDDPKPNEATATFQAPTQLRFNVPLAGTLDRIDAPHLLNGIGSGTINLRVRLLNGMDNTPLAEGVLNVPATSAETSPYGDPYQIKLDKPVKVDKDQLIIFEASADVPVQTTGTVIAREGDWDDPIPWALCQIPAEMELTHDTPSGVNPRNCPGIGSLGYWYKSVELEMALEDDQLKRDTMTKALDHTDYFIISSNRFYDTLTRMPLRFPMSAKFYEELFAGRLGFDVLKTVTSYPLLGSFEIADQNLPTYNSPKWMNEWESEEAFSVYDHPTVFIFKKNSQYTPQLLHSVLYSVPTNEAKAISFKDQDTTLINRVTWNPTESSPAPTGFMMTPDLQAIQSQGGTWSDLFNRNWAINASPLLAIVAFWLAVSVIGWAAWPLVYALLPGLPDRGYPLVKIAGLLIVSWIVWAGGTLRLLTWSGPGILLTALALLAVNVYIGYRKRDEFLDYMRLNWRHFVIVELIALILFVVFLFVRLGNPDLWAQSLGGEKPMDFAYFNAVLRSTVFPPYDPWYAGGYLNYYYFGFVFVGAPVKLLGIMPSAAYNLVLPLLFSMTGLGVFSLAFNIVAARWFFPRDDGDEHAGIDDPIQPRRRFALRIPSASPYIAGVLALLLCLVLGNLDTPRVFITGLIRAGGYNIETNDMYLWKLNDFIRRTGRQPTPEESVKLTEEAGKPSIGDQIGYGVYNFSNGINAFGKGIGQVLSGGILPISPDRWFWAPRSIVGELPGASNEINEFPYFTFVFGDLHAHVIALPMTLLVLGWLFSEVMAAGAVIRSKLAVAGSIIFGGLAVGILQPTNTWDWFTYLLLAVLTLIFTFYLRRQRLGRRSVLTWAVVLVGLFIVQWIAALPFTAFWATSYVSGNALKAFEGNKTPIWAYLDMHGLFLFFIVSLLIWQTARLLRRVYVRDFIGRTWPLLLIAGAIMVAVLLTLFLALVPINIWLLRPPIPLAIICIPLLAWCAILFFVPDQSREMRVLLALTGLALGVTFGVEIVVLGADIGRQNTFFKFYMQAWILFSIVAAVALAWLLQASERWRGWLRSPWLAMTALLLAIAALFPIMSTQGKIALRMAPQAPHVLDGNAYMDYATYYEGSKTIPLKGDLDIIHWLQDNVKGTPVILEAQQTEYKLGSRIAINTGLPTIVGWNFHQRQQRTIDPLPNMVFQRVANVAGLYNTPDIFTAWRMLKYFNVEYIIVGKLEQAIYEAPGLAKFEAMAGRGLLKAVYQNNGDTIYQVVHGATLPDTVAMNGQ